MSRHWAWRYWGLSALGLAVLGLAVLGLAVLGLAVLGPRLIAGHDDSLVSARTGTRRGLCPRQAQYGISSIRQS